MNNIGKDIINQKNEEELDQTPPNKDKYFIKHMVNMQTTHHECIFEHRDLKLIWKENFLFKNFA